MASEQPDVTHGVHCEIDHMAQYAVYFLILAVFPSRSNNRNILISTEYTPRNESPSPRASPEVPAIPVSWSVATNF